MLDKEARVQLSNITVKELKEELDNYDEDATVFIEGSDIFYIHKSIDDDYICIDESDLEEDYDE